jgi:hypothetical protein
MKEISDHPFVVKLHYAFQSVKTSSFLLKIIERKLAFHCRFLYRRGNVLSHPEKWKVPRISG